MSGHVITANGLRDGLILYLSVDGTTHRWTNDFAKATRLEEDALEGWLTAARADQDAAILVDPYALELDADGHPVTQREKIRSDGPSVAFGHQALRR